MDDLQTIVREVLSDPQYAYLVTRIANDPLNRAPSLAFLSGIVTYELHKRGIPQPGYEVIHSALKGTLRAPNDVVE